MSSIQTIYDILLTNNYPKQLIARLVSKFTNKNNQESTHGNLRTPKIYKGLTYTPGLSENLQKLFKTYNQHIQIGNKPHKTLNKIINNKSNQATNENFEEVYKTVRTVKEYILARRGVN